MLYFIFSLTALSVLLFLQCAPIGQKTQRGDVISRDIPLVVRWDSFPLNIHDAQNRFKVSEWNYFYVDREADLLMGYWEVEEGSETIGGVDGDDAFDEIMLVLEGELYISSPGMKDETARPGDVIMGLRHRQMTITSKEPVRAFFICWDIDVEAYKQFLREGNYYKK